MSDWREIAYGANRDRGNEYGGEDSDTEIARLRARIRELEERLHERDLAVAALSQQLAACNPTQDSDAERTQPPSPSESVEGGDDSSADAADDRLIITWHDAGDEHP